MLKKTTLLALAFTVLFTSLKAQTDSIANQNAKENTLVKKAVVPGILIAGSFATWKLRKDVREMRNRFLPTFENHYDDKLQYMPAVAVFGLNAAGVKGKHSIGRAAVSYGFSALFMASIVNAVKYTARVERPDGSTRNSYPSGHTANSFMNATFLHKEYGERSHLYSIGGYAMSTATAVGRQLNNRHWISDVLAGAGIGILSTELGYWVTDKIFKEKGENFRMSDAAPAQIKPSFIEMKLGYSRALSKDLTPKTDELYAKEGFKVGVEGAYFFHKNIGLGGEFSFISFPIEDTGVKFGDPELDEINEGTFTNAMGIRYFMAGPYFSFPLPKNWFITANVNAGASAGARGEMTIQIKDEYEYLFDRKEIPFFKYKPERAFAWGAGLGIQKRIKSNFGLKAYVNYLNSKNNFGMEYISDLDMNGNFIYSNLGSEKVRFDNLTYGVGITAFLW